MWCNLIVQAHVRHPTFNHVLYTIVWIGQGHGVDDAKQHDFLGFCMTAVISQFMTCSKQIQARFYNNCFVWITSFNCERDSIIVICNTRGARIAAICDT